MPYINNYLYAMIYIKYLYLLKSGHYCIYYTAISLHCYTSDIYMLILCLFRANYINLVTVPLLNCWPLYFKYSYTYFIPIISILSPLYIKYLYTHSMLIILILSLLYIRYSYAYSIRINCINLVTIAPLHCWLLYVKYSHTHSILIIWILSPLYRYITILPYVRYSRIHSMPITSILLPPHHYAALHCHSITLLYYYIILP